MFMNEAGWILPVCVTMFKVKTLIGKVFLPALKEGLRTLPPPILLEFRSPFRDNGKESRP
jgi:hypothetical protein